MTDDEIVQSFENAQMQSKQIGILAQLNQCSKADIAKILYGRGKITKSQYGAHCKKPRKKASADPDGGFAPREAAESVIRDRINDIKAVVNDQDIPLIKELLMLEEFLKTISNFDSMHNL